MRMHVAPRPADAAVVRTTQSSRGFRGRPPCTPPARWRSRTSRRLPRCRGYSGNARC